MCDWICQVRTVCMRVRDSLEWCIVNTQREVRIKKENIHAVYCGLYSTAV